jgi:dUTP pyrophosphatase
MKKVEVKIIKENGVDLPKYMTIGAAGMDICANISESITLKTLERKLIPTGIKMEIPFGYEVQVRPRSGLALKHGITLVNSPGTIDSDYRGDVGVILINLSNEEYTVTPKERIGQLVLQKVNQMEFLEVQELGESTRSTGGFGHTGK